MSGCTWTWIYNRQKNCYEHRCIDGISPNRPIDYCESPHVRAGNLDQMLVEMPVVPAMPGEVFVSQSPGPGLYNMPPGGWVYSDSFGPMPFGSFAGIGGFGGGGAVVFVRDFHTREIIEAEIRRPEDTPLPHVVPPLPQPQEPVQVPPSTEPTTYTEMPSQLPTGNPVAVPEGDWIGLTVAVVIIAVVLIVDFRRKCRG